MALVFYSNEGARPSEKAYITTDKQGRIYINRLAQKEMNALTLPQDFYIAYDAAALEIYFTQDANAVPEGHKPFRFNGNRAYASAKSFLGNARILPNPNEDAHRYFFNRQEGPFFVFSREVIEQDIEVNDAPEGQTNIDEMLQEDIAPTAPPTDAAQEPIETQEETKNPVNLNDRDVVRQEMIEVLKADTKTSFRKLEERTGFDRKELSKIAKEFSLR